MRMRVEFLSFLLALPAAFAIGLIGSASDHLVPAFCAVALLSILSGRVTRR